MMHQLLLKKVLERLIWGPPRGSVGDIKNPGPGVTWLLEENFMVPLDQRTVILPREVGIYLRGGKVHKEREVTPPEIKGSKARCKECSTGSNCKRCNCLAMGR